METEKSTDTRMGNSAAREEERRRGIGGNYLQVEMGERGGKERASRSYAFKSVRVWRKKTGGEPPGSTCFVKRHSPST